MIRSMMGIVMMVKWNRCIRYRRKGWWWRGRWRGRRWRWRRRWIGGCDHFVAIAAVIIHAWIEVKVRRLKRLLRVMLLLIYCWIRVWIGRIRTWFTSSSRRWCLILTRRVIGRIVRAAIRRRDAAVIRMLIRRISVITVVVMVSNLI